MVRQDCMTRYILAVDQGTTSSRAVLFDLSLRVVVLIQIPMYTPRIVHSALATNQRWPRTRVRENTTAGQMPFGERCRAHTRCRRRQATIALAAWKGRIDRDGPKSTRQYSADRSARACKGYLRAPSGSSLTNSLRLPSRR